MDAIDADRAGPGARPSAAARRPAARRSWPARCGTRCFPAARASGRGCASPWPRACGDDDPALADAAAAAIELLHCASLVHDDLPCFDDAADAARPRRRCTAPSASPWRCWPATR